MMTLEQAAKQAGGGNRIRFSEWPAGIYWIVPTNDLMTFETEFPNDSCTDKAVLTGRLLVEPKWEVVSPDIREGDRVYVRNGIWQDTQILDVVWRRNNASSVSVQFMDDIPVTVKVSDCIFFHRPEKPEEHMFAKSHIGFDPSGNFSFNGKIKGMPCGVKTYNVTFTEVPDES